MSSFAVKYILCSTDLLSYCTSVSLDPEAHHQGAACDSSTLASNWPDLHGEASTFNHLAEKSCSGCFVCWICTCLCLFSIMVQHSIVCRMNPGLQQIVQRYHALHVSLLGGPLWSTAIDVIRHGEAFEAGQSKVSQ